MGSFGSILFGDNMPGRILGSLNFWGSLGQKVQILKHRQNGYECENESVSQKVQKFGERSFLMKHDILYGGFERWHSIIDF